MYLCNPCRRVGGLPRILGLSKGPCNRCQTIADCFDYSNEMLTPKVRERLRAPV